MNQGVDATASDNRYLFSSGTGRAPTLPAPGTASDLYAQAMLKHFMTTEVDRRWRLIDRLDRGR